MEQTIESTRQCCTQADTPPSGPPFLRAFSNLVTHPLKILLAWNWKSAWLSILLRSPIFLAASIRRGFKTMVAAVLVECFFCAATAGFYGALIQTLRDAQPLWVTAVFLTVAVPGVLQVFEAYLHWSRGTPHWRIAEIVSVFISAISSLFNWYAMRQGTFLVGAEGKSFGADLRRFPLLFFSFIAYLPRHILRKRGSQSNPIFPS